MASSSMPEQYDSAASSYDAIEALPHSRPSQQLVLHALGDCTDQTILDLGGGSGLHARNAIDRGAARIDNVDIAPEMLRNCERAEERAGRKPGDRVRCFVGDMMKPLDHLELGEYDVVMVNWTFDHADTVEELETAWENVTKHCRSGGKVISIRTNDPWRRGPNSSKYGVVLSNMERVPGGVRYIYTVQHGEGFSAEATNMEANYDFEKSREMARKFSFEGLEAVDAGEMQIVKEDWEYWKYFLEYPGFVCVFGRKI